MSEIDPRGGQHFSNKSEIQKSLKYPIGGGGSSLFGKKSTIFLFFNYDASLKYQRFFVSIIVIVQMYCHIPSPTPTQLQLG